MITPYVFSPTPNELTAVGKLIKRIGKRGELLASFSVKFKSFPPAFLIFDKHECYPLIVETVSTRNDDFIVKFEGIEYEKAVQLSNCQLYVLPELLSKISASVVKSSIVGYSVMTQEGEKLGEVIDVVEYPQQHIICFNYQGQEVMFPWVDDIVLKINQRKKELRVDLPEGILQLNYKK
ncbi:MAG: ribosome maturation factor RimM [Bacteroidota bacterium]